MGMPGAFDGAAADFSPMCPDPPDGEHLYIADILQIDVPTGAILFLGHLDDPTAS